MSPALRTHFVNELLAAIRSINPQFEAFGQRVADRLSPVPLIHRGLNAEGAPVGHVVDSASADGSVVFEYSAAKDYYTKPYTKIAKDWRHARRTHPGGRTIYLLSSRLCGEKAHSRLLRFAAARKARHGVELHVYDARRLAEYLVDVVLPADRPLDDLIPFVGPLARIRATYAATHRVPEAPTGRAAYVARPALERDVLGRLARDRAAVLAGLSGLGKSELAAAVARAARDTYDAVIWVEDAAVRSAADLESVPVERYGVRTNVRYLLREYASLVVLDNAGSAVDVPGLVAASGPRSAVLVTRQSVRAGDWDVPLLDEDEARRLLEHRADRACPDAVFARVREAVGGFPIALTLLGGLAANTSWDAVLASLPAVGELPDPDDNWQQLAGRVLGRLQQPLRRPLAFLRWCDAVDLDEALADYVLGPAYALALRQAGLLAAGRRGTLRLHDVVRASVAALDPPSPADAAAFARGVADHIATATRGGAVAELQLLNVGRVHRELLARLARATPEEPAYAYALLQVWHASEFDADLVGDLHARARALAAASAPIPDLAVHVVLEAVEARWRYDKYVADQGRARATLASHLAVYDTLEQAPGISAAARRDVRHQRAKALRNLGDYAAAERQCEALVADGVASPATLLLLGRLVAGDKGRGDDGARRARDLFVTILEAADADPDAVGASVLLATIGEFARGVMDTWAADAMDRFRGLIHRALVEAAQRGLPQGLEALAAVARYYGWRAPERLEAILAEVPPTFAAQAATTNDRTAWGDILLAASQTGDRARARAYLEHALTFYEEIEQPRPFHRQQKGRTLYELGRFAEAAAVLEPLAAEDRQPFSRYWLSKALLGLGDASRALGAIDDALGRITEGARGRSYAATFLEQRYAVRASLGAPDALDDLQRAHDAAGDPRYRGHLAARLAAARTTPRPEQT